MRAKRPIRRAQLVSTFGVGAMIDFPGDESLLIAGIDAWPGARKECEPDLLVQEERLQRRLGVSHFRLPEDYRERGAGVVRPEQSIAAVRFPQWHYCPRCGGMRKLTLFETGRVRCSAESACAAKPESRRPFVIPVRIVSACRDGHIQDFPFDRWAHNGAEVSPEHRVRYVAAGSSASLSGIRIVCTCGASRSLAGSFDYDEEQGSALSRLGVRCSAARPWLGEPQGERGCERPLRTMQRGASNVYFPFTVSSIYLPLWGEGEPSAIIRTIEDPLVWETLSQGLEDGTRIQMERCRIVARLRRLDAEELRAAAQRKLDGLNSTIDDTSEVEYRRAEYDAFRSGRGSESVELLVELRDAASYSGSVTEAIAQIGLVHKLRETRALAGFTRVAPPEGLDDRRLQRISRKGINWLPAAVVRGEGIFVEMDRESLERWAGNANVQDRARTIANSFNGARAQRGLEAREVTPEFVLLHTIAHLLVKQLSFDAGYGSASLRERIYAGGDANDPMTGFLIYTASGDSEGTLGGLVRLGEPGRFEAILSEALLSAQWCSSDPVCIESGGQGTDSANRAACHGCVLISETSCEEGNRLLDRGLVIGTLDGRVPGFFDLTALAAVSGS